MLATTALLTAGALFGIVFGFLFGHVRYISHRKSVWTGLGIMSLYPVAIVITGYWGEGLGFIACGVIAGMISRTIARKRSLPRRRIKVGDCA